MMYTSAKRQVPREWIESPTFGSYVRFSCGIVAGFGASIVTQPADVIKTKMQLFPNKFQTFFQVLPYVYHVSLLTFGPLKILVKAHYVARILEVWTQGILQRITATNYSQDSRCRYVMDSVRAAYEKYWPEINRSRELGQ